MRNMVRVTLGKNESYLRKSIIATRSGDLLTSSDINSIYQNYTSINSKNETLLWVGVLNNRNNNQLSLSVARPMVSSTLSEHPLIQCEA